MMSAPNFGSHLFQVFFFFFFEQTVFQGQVSYNLKRAWKRLLLCKKKTNENELTFKTS